MLVLSRQRDETIMIGDDIEITVVDIRGDKVRLGITAPPHIPVHRKEVWLAIKRENEEAARVQPQDLARGQEGAEQPGGGERPKSGNASGTGSGDAGQSPGNTPPQRGEVT